VKQSEIDARLAELKSAWQRLEAENDEIVRTAPVTDGVVRIDANRREAFSRNLAAMREIKAERELLEAQRELAEWGRQAERDPVALSAGVPAPAAPRGLVGKSLGQMFVESEEFKALQASGAASMPHPWRCNGIDMGAHARWVERKDVYTTAPTGSIPAGFAPLQREDIVVQGFRSVRVRDLFPVQQTSAAVIEFFRVTGFTSANNASVVPEYSGGTFGLKPHTNLTFTGVQAPVRTIAHWEAAHRNVLADVPQLQGIIDTELLYGLRLAEDHQILNGTGTGEDLTGILNTAGIQSYTHGGSDTKADDIRRAVTKALLAYYEPTGIVIHPNDWEDIELLKDSQGRYVVAGAVASGAEQRLWRIPVVDTPAMPEGTALVGAFGLGAQLYDRMEGSVRVAEQHADFFLRNAVVILAEERIALTVRRPESFVKVSF
jgi:HK97 family phage major capsid protein